MKSSARVIRTLFLLLAVGYSPAVGQSREELIDQARAELVGSQAALDLLLAASDPVGSPPDSAWSVGVFDLADNLINVGQTDVAAVWLRWVARHGPQWPIDRDWYSPIVIDAYDVAAPAVTAVGGLGNEAASTTWRWPEAFDAGAQGTLEVQSASGVPLSVNVQNFGPLPASGTMALPAGTYVLTASAPGMEQVQVSREVLPGVATLVSFDLPPLFPAATEGRVSAALARIRFQRAGQQVCANGVIVAGGLVLTTLSGIQGAAGLQVANAQGTYGNAALGPSDAERDLVVLRTSGGLGAPLTRASAVTDGQYAFSVYQDGCAAPVTGRTRLSGWSTPATSTVALQPALGAPVSGAPLVDASGALLGLVLDQGSALPIQLADDLLDEAGAGLVAQVPGATAGGGGVPRWLFIAGGVGAAGIGAALLLGGGGGGSGGGGGGGSTGSIIFRFPNIGGP